MGDRADHRREAESTSETSLPTSDTAPRSPGLLEQLVEASSAVGRQQSGGVLVGECLEVPPVGSRASVRVRWVNAEGHIFERWLPTVRNVAVREADRVLLMQPVGLHGPIVVGVVNGFSRRPDPPRSASHSLALRPDEVLLVTDHEGHALLEVSRSERGLTLRPVARDLEVSVPGTLALRAGQISLEAERGDVHVTASDSVVARGELIKLN